MWLKLHIESVLNGYSAGVYFLKEKDINIWLSKKMYNLIFAFLIYFSKTTTDEGGNLNAIT
jgi:hypothetical protein